MSLELYPDQEIIYKKIIDNLYKKPLCVLPTGGGKTIVALFVIKYILSIGKTIDIIAHRIEILDQFKKLLASENIPFGINKQTNDTIQICGIDTLVARLGEYNFSDFCLYDEAHHGGAKNHGKIVSSYKNIIGFTATPERYDNIGLDSIFNLIIEGETTASLIKLGRLVPAEIISTDPPDYSGLTISNGDFNIRQTVMRVDTPQITGNVIDHYLKYANNTKTVVFCCNVKHAHGVKKSFKNSGITAEIITGSMNKINRAEVINNFRNGLFNILIAIDVISEGFDIPDIKTVILLRPTMSLALYLQQIGRALRIFNGKTHAIVIDAVGNVYRHGLPWEKRLFSLRGKTRTEKNITDHSENIFRCGECFHVYESYLDVCPFCGAGKNKRERVIKTVSGELSVITETEYRKMIDERIERDEMEKRLELEQIEKINTIKILKKQAIRLADFQNIASFAGYDNGWAYIQYNLKNKYKNY